MFTFRRWQKYTVNRPGRLVAEVRKRAEFLVRFPPTPYPIPCVLYSNLERYGVIHRSSVQTCYKRDTRVGDGTSHHENVASLHSGHPPDANIGDSSSNRSSHFLVSP
jgi:hypothetical protein